VAAAIYIAINLAVSRLAIWIEKRGSKKAAGGTAHVPAAGTAPAK
jgi:glutamate transport system permease protein